MIAKILPMFSESQIAERRNFYIIKDGQPARAGELLRTIEINRMENEFTPDLINYLTRIRNRDQLFFSEHCFCPGSCICIVERKLAAIEKYCGLS